MPSEEEVIKAISESCSISEIMRKLGICRNTINQRMVKDVADKHNLQIPLNGRKSKYSEFSKTCPVCGKDFVTTDDPSEAKITCSYLCSNRYFRTKHLLGEFGPETKIYHTNYRTLCINHYGHKCVFCDWDMCVDVHHIDRDRSNNDISNLIPLCPNHHALTKLSEYRDDMDKRIHEFKKANP